jgi:predicted DsbA family dithiol-disulfide isomerase
VTDVAITEFTDPGCPWAFSAEPFRLKLDWTYGDQIAWEPRMVVLSEDTSAYAERGFTPEMLAGGMATIAREHGMPIDTAPRERIAATVDACRAVVAACLHAPQAVRPLLRALRVRNFRGELIDDAATLRAAAADAGLDGDTLAAWSADAAVEAALREDMDRARHPTPAALAQDARLADWEGGRRYTCPSYEIARGETTLTVPGFQPLAAYLVALANLFPEAEQRPAPERVEDVLAWAGTPLASQEVAVLMGIDRGEARQRLARVAHEDPVGSDGYWTLAD